MIGESIERSAPTAPWWFVWTLFAAGLAGLNLATDSNHFIRVALAPFAMALTCLIARPRSFQLDIVASGLQFKSPSREFVPFDHIQRLIREEKPASDDSFAFDSAHTGGMLHVPGELNVSSSQLWKFLSDRLPPESNRLPPALCSYQSKQAELFGSDRVSSYLGVPRSVAPQSSSNLLFGVAIVLVGIAWIASGEKGGDYEVWSTIGYCTMMIGFIVLLVALLVYSSRKRR